jgi:hypothetical protein
MTYLLQLQGKCSWFGGPDDAGVKSSEGLAFIQSIEDAPYLFLPEQPPNTTGLARRLNPDAHFIACRWDYAVTPSELLLKETVLIRAVRTGIVMRAFPADWGPHVDTGRIADISMGLMNALDIETDDEVTVVFPYKLSGVEV